MGLTTPALSPSNRCQHRIATLALRPAITAPRQGLSPCTWEPQRLNRYLRRSALGHRMSQLARLGETHP